MLPLVRAAVSALPPCSSYGAYSLGLWRSAREGPWYEAAFGVVNAIAQANSWIDRAIASCWPHCVHSRRSHQRSHLNEGMHVQVIACRGAVSEVWRDYVLGLDSGPRSNSQKQAHNQILADQDLNEALSILLTMFLRGFLTH